MDNAVAGEHNQEFDIDIFMAIAKIRMEKDHIRNPYLNT